MGGTLIRPQSQKIFACGGQKIVFFVFLEQKNFRLRRAKNRVLYVFGDKNFPQKKAGPKSFYERRNALLLFEKRSSSRADAVPDVFTSVGTRFYYSQNDLTATQTQFLAFSGV